MHCLGDSRKRAEIPEDAGHLPLAYATVSAHGLAKIPCRLTTEFGENVPCVPEGKHRSLFTPYPLISSVDWPSNSVTSYSFFKVRYITRQARNLGGFEREGGYINWWNRACGTIYGAGRFLNEKNPDRILLSSLKVTYTLVVKNLVHVKFRAMSRDLFLGS